MTIRVLLALAGFAALAGTAEAQRRLPEYDELLNAVSRADCVRSEAESHIRFICRESRAVWYFTKAGSVVHPAYQEFPAWTSRNEVPNLTGALSSGPGAGPPGETPEQFSVRAAAVRDWMRETFNEWRRTQPRVE